MSTRIGLVSDVHASAAPLREALAIFESEGVEMILCPGDIAGYGDELDETVRLLVDSRCQAILGNHEVWCLEKAKEGDQNSTLDYFRSLPEMLDLDIEGRHLHMAHASPPNSINGGIRLLDEEGQILPEQRRAWSRELEHLDYDVLVIGHTHQVFAEQLGGMLVINPGSATYNHSCAILDLPVLGIQWFSLSGKTLRKAWNWGNQVGAGKSKT